MSWYLALAADLGRLIEHGRRGETDWRPTAPSSSVSPAFDPALEAMIEAAWRSGFSLAPSLTALRSAVTHAAGLRQAVQELRSLLYLRSALGLVAALLTRLCLLGPSAWHLLSPRDLSAVLFAVAVNLAMHLLLVCSVPRPWLGHHGLSAAALAWFEAHLSGDIRPDAPLAADLHSLAERQLRLGISLKAEQRSLLTAWARNEVKGGRHRLRQLASYLPLLELFGIGLPLLLLVAEPFASLVAA